MRDGSWLVGRKQSIETRKKRSVSMMGKNKGNHLSEEHKKAVSVAHKGKLFSNEHRRKLSFVRKGKPLSEEVRMKLSRNFENKDFVNRFNNTLNRGYHNGVFDSIKNNCKIYFGSSYELQAYLHLEYDHNVKQYGRVYFSILYVYRGRAHRYVPDILVEYIDGSKAIIEVKPLVRLKEALNIIKSIAGREYCRENNMEYIIWTEDDLFGGE